MIRKPIITVLGHVDAGKSTLLDTIRGTDIVAKEPGGITQHIGATEVPIGIVTKISAELIDKYRFNITIPGLLFIDTPGHEAFTNLRKRGGSIADLAVLVVDVMKGIQNQTAEAIEILRSYKTPFVVAANKIDAIQGWKTSQQPFTTNEKRQTEEAQRMLDVKIYELVGQLYRKGFTTERFDRCKNFTKEIPIIPVCARSGEGIAELLLFLAGLSQRYLEQKLAIEVIGAGRGSVLEVKNERGLGRTIDVILYSGTIRIGQQIVVGGRTRVIQTKVKALLEPKPLEEMRVSQEKFRSVREVSAAAGVKIAASDLDEAVAGATVMVVENGGEAQEIENEIQNIKVETDLIGPLVKVDTLGSLEAMVKLLADKNIKVRKADIGEVSRRDIMEMEAIAEKDHSKGVIFAFHCPVAEEAQEEASKRKVKIFCGNVIYKLLEDYDAWLKEEDSRRRAEKLAQLTLPVKFRILQGYVFRNSKPAIVGVRVLAGRLRPGIEVTKDGKIIGKVEVVQVEGKAVEEAKTGVEVAVSIDDGVVGRNIAEGDELLSHIPKKHMEELLKVPELLTKSEIELLEEIRLAGVISKDKNK